MEEGIAFAATGDKYRAMAARAARRIDEISDYPCCLFTDEEPGAEVFDEVIILDDPDHGFADAVDNIHRPPYTKTIWFDVDTYVVDPEALEDIFTVLERFDVAAAHDSLRNASQQYDVYEPPEVPVPDAVPWYNVGLVAYRDNEATDELFKRWREIYQEHRDHAGFNVNSQIAFRQALYEVAPKIATLPREYNYRLDWQQTVVGDVKILHGATDKMEKFADTLNSSAAQRTYNTAEINGTMYLTRYGPGWKRVLYWIEDLEHLSGRITHHLREGGVRQLLGKAQWYIGKKLRS